MVLNRRLLRHAMILLLDLWIGVVRCGRLGLFFAYIERIFVEWALSVWVLIWQLLLLRS